MDNQRRMLEALERCIASVVYYRACGKDRDARGVMTSEVQGVAQEIASWVDAEKDFLPRMEAELVARYGFVEGHKLAKEFNLAFASASEPARSDADEARWDKIPLAEPTGRASAK